MSIIIQFNSAFNQSAVAVKSDNQCHPKENVKLEMVPGIEHFDVPGMTDDENSIDVASSSAFSTTLREVKITNNHSGSYFGLPYQDHNYGAPPPPTPPSVSPCPSPVRSIPIPDEDSTLSVVSNTTNEEIQEKSVTRCICGFEHDDEYMIACDTCGVWQHIDCMGIDRDNIPDTYLCDECEPRKLDRQKAKLLQSRKKGSLMAVKQSQPVLTKQEHNFNNRLFRKNFKKKSHTNDSGEWASVHERDVSENYNATQRFNYSSDSGDGLKQNTERRPKTRSKRRKREEDKNLDIREPSTKKKSKKHGKERMEAKRTKLRRVKNKESTSTADEEAQDAWEYSLEWCEKNFEDAINNQYTPEIQHLARTLSMQGFEKKYLEQMRSKQCHAYDDGKRKQLVCLRDLPRNSPLIEYKGKFLLASQFHDIHPLYNKRLYPYVLFYVLDHEEICVDASMYGNDARFVRRSCKPNAEIRHMVYSGKLHLYLTSTRVIFREDEVTIPLKIHPNDRMKDFECACGSEECLVKPKKKNGTIEVVHEKRRRTRRSTMTIDEISNHSVDVKPTRQSTKVNPANEKPKPVPIKSEPIEPQIIQPEISVPVKEESDFKSENEHEPEELSSGSKRKPTREERKLEAIMRAFSKMEQAEKRKQQSIEKHKSHIPKVESSDEKPEAEPKKEESPTAVINETVQNEHKDEDKPAPQTPKSKKGKRRRGSGTPSRRRTRTCSGGSELMSLEELLPSKNAPPSDINSSSSIENIIPVPVSSPPPSTSSGLLSPVPAVMPVSPHVLKTKRSLMNEWLQEKSEGSVTTTVSSPLPIHTEMKWTSTSTTCYVRCTKDTPHSSGISAAHLRRSNSAGHMKQATGPGSAKKRWLKQAYYDKHGCEIQLKTDSCGLEHPSNIDNGCLSPNGHADADNLSGAGEDVQTPLKKRRLMRESIESQPSPPSPSTATSIDDTDATTVSNSLISDNSTEHGSDAVDSESCVEKDHFSPTSLDDSKSLIIKPCDSEIVEDNNSAENYKVSEAHSETYFTPISTLELISEENNVHKTEELSNKITPSLSEKDLTLEVSEKLLSDSSGLSENTDMDNSKTTAGSQFSESFENLETSKISLTSECKTSSDLETRVSDEIHENQNCLNSDQAVTSDKKNSFAQIQSQNVSAATIAPSSVNNSAPIQTNNSTPSLSSTTDSCDIMQSLIKNNDSKSELSSSSMQNNKNDIFSSMQNDKKYILTINTVKYEKNCMLSKNNSVSKNLSENENCVNIKDDDSTNKSSDSYHKTKLSPISSCNNVNHSSFSSKKFNDIEICVEAVENGSKNIQNTSSNKKSEEKAMEVEGSTLSDVSSVKVDDAASKCKSQSQCESKEDSTPDVKNCASATKKRKVSLSEYRLRMKENTAKHHSTSESAVKNQNTTSICAISLPDTLPEQVTLAPLPLFEKIRAQKKAKQPIQHYVSKIKKENPKVDLEINEHRENLNERLKREFGFDVSDSSRSSPPPPPPPPRHTRPMQKESINVAIPPSRFRFNPPPFPQVRPQFMVPRVPGSPFLPAQAPILPAVHSINSNSAQCSIQPPLLPTTHPFTPSMALLRPPRHDYSPVNAQRFAALVQQPPPPPPPPPTHKSYLHVYPSGLYK